MQFLGDQTLGGSGELILSDDPQNRILTNNTTVTNDAAHTIRGGGLVLNNTGDMVNDGTIRAEGTMSIDPNGLGFTNNGTLEATSGSVLNLLGGNYTNNSSIHAADSAVVTVGNAAAIVGGNLTTPGSGVFELLSLSTLDGVTANGNLSQANGQDVNILNGMTNNGTWTMNGAGSDAFAQFIGNQTLGGSGELILNSDPQNRVLTDGTTLTNGVDHTIRGGGQLLNNTGGLINEGTIIADSSSVVIAVDATALGFSNSVTGKLQATGDAGIDILSCGFSNAGSVAITTNSRIDRTGDYTQTGGKTTVHGTLTTTTLVDLQGGLLEGSGVVEGNVDNSGGTVNAGAASLDLTDALNIDCSYNQGNMATLSVEIGGLGQGIDYDWLNIITGDATLAGALSVSLTGGFMASLGDTFDILTADNVFGTFDINQLLFPIFGGKTFDIIYLSDTVRLTTVAAQVVPVTAAVWLFA